VVTAASVRNALRVLLAIGGSTNALVHLTAMAGRLGLAIDPDELNELSETTPVLVELKPTGSHYMEDLHASGGLPAVLHELRDLLDLSVLTVTGKRWGSGLEVGLCGSIGTSYGHCMSRAGRKAVLSGCADRWRHLVR
jgi:dihydroxy-acid dehydratase